jgi:hypothetical protein
VTPAPANIPAAMPDSLEFPDYDDDYEKCDEDDDPLVEQSPLELQRALSVLRDASDAGQLAPSLHEGRRPRGARPRTTTMTGRPAPARRKAANDDDDGRGARAVLQSPQRC